MSSSTARHSVEGRRFAPASVLALIALGVAAVIALAGCASAGASHPAAAARPARHASSHSADLTSQSSSSTTRRTFAAYDSTGGLTVPVGRTAKGYCWSTSLATPSLSTYRCFAGNQILDPCFARPGSSGAAGTTVACVADPWSKAVVLTLTKRLPRADITAHRVWTFLRSDGARCVAATGTVPAVQGHNLPYNCSDGTAAALTHTGAQRVDAVFAKPTATKLGHATVRTIWTT